MFIKNILIVLEGLIYISLGVVAATIVIVPLTPLLTNHLVEGIEEITEILLFTIIILFPIPAILNRYISSSNHNALTTVVNFLKSIHIVLGILFIGLRILHVEVNFLFEPIVWNFEITTSILLSLLLIPTVIYGVLRMNDSQKYCRPHRFFLILTYLTFVIHLFH